MAGRDGMIVADLIGARIKGHEALRPMIVPPCRISHQDIPNGPAAMEMWRVRGFAGQEKSNFFVKRRLTSS